MLRPGGTFFFTLCTYNRHPLFADAGNVERLRQALRAVMTERPFEILAGVVLPDHLHWIWQLPREDSDYPSRIGRVKVLFTRSLGRGADDPPACASRRRHHESAVWQRRYWEHTIRDTDDLNAHLNYIHYNPVKHGLVTCPHAWPASSFHRFVAAQAYPANWCCACKGKGGELPYPPALAMLE